MIFDTLLSHVLENVDNLTENYGEQVVFHAMMKAHNPDLLLGIFWYNILTGELDYSSTLKHHNQFDRYQEYFKTNGMIRGRITKDGDVNFVLIYTDDFAPQSVSGKVVADLYSKLQRAAEIHVDWIVDEMGRDLITENVKAIKV